jgi:hypothetical protein
MIPGNLNQAVLTPGEGGGIDPGGGDTGANSGLKYWFNGLPYNGKRVATPSGGLKFWFNGLPDNMGLK